LTAVSPDGLSVVNGDCPGRELSGTVRNCLEVRVKTAIELAAWVSEGRLSDGVVLLVEFEDDGITGLSGNEGGIKCELSGSTNNDGVNSTLRRDRSGVRRARIRAVSCGPDSGSKGDGLCNGSYFRGRWDSVATVSSCCNPSRSGSRRSSSSGKASTNSKGRLLEVSERVGCTILTTVDGEDHPSTAVTGRSLGSLLAVHPDWLGVVDRECPGRQVIGLVGSNGYETRVEAALLATARIGERRLGHSVVFGIEMENNLITRLCRNRFGNKLKLPPLPADLDIVHCS